MSPVAEFEFRRAQRSFDIDTGWREPRFRSQRAQILTAPGAPHMAQGEKLKR